MSCGRRFAVRFPLQSVNTFASDAFSGKSISHEVQFAILRTNAVHVYTSAGFSIRRRIDTVFTKHMNGLPNLAERLVLPRSTGFDEWCYSAIRLLTAQLAIVHAVVGDKVDTAGAGLRIRQDIRYPLPKHIDFGHASPPPASPCYRIFGNFSKSSPVHRPAYT